jgi:hypothetical protein
MLRKKSMNYQGMLRNYRKIYLPRTDGEIEYYRNRPDLRSALISAAKAFNQDEKKHGHQWRIRKSAIDQVQIILLDSFDQIEQTKDFEELISLLEWLLGGVSGIGELYIYDTALRIGAKLGFMPDKVYLHASTRKGAAALGLSSRVRALDLSMFPDELQVLLPYQLEDVLCIYFKPKKKK